MKVLVVTNLYPPFAKGGAEAVAKLTAEGFRDKGDEVHVLTAGPWRGSDSLFLNCVEEDGIQVHRFYPANFYFYGDKKVRPAWLRYLWLLGDMVNLHSWLVVRKLLRKERFGLVVSHNLRGLGYLLPRLFARHARSSVQVLHDVQLVEPSGLLFHDAATEQLARWYMRPYQWVTRLLFATVPAVVSPSRFLLEFYRARGFFGRAKCAVIANPLPVDDMTIQSHSGINVVFIGQLEKHKGVEVLLEAWEKASLDGATLHIVGDGSFIPSSRDKSDTVTWHGRLDGAALHSVWEIADCIVYPSLVLENAPTVVAEAVCRGIPVIASKVGGIPELVRSDDVLVSPGDVDALCEALDATVAHDQITGLNDFSDRHKYVQHLKAVISRS